MKDQKEKDIISLKLKTGGRHFVSGNHYRTGRDKAIILAHGFFNNKDVYLFRTMTEDIFETFDVVSFDFRGHGKSSGLFEWTSQETEDLERIIRYTKEQGYQSIGIIGFSLGAAVTLITASENKDLASVMAVSAPYDFWKIDYHFWEPEMFKDLQLNFGKKGVGKGVRPGNPFQPKIKPVDIVGKIAPTPVLFLHGDKDWLIKLYHSEKLYEAAREPKRLVIVPGAGHAEMIYNTHRDQFMTLCREWFGQTLSE